mmetsp:Transcript_29923/g.45766  ORF Transcript_29923/g.45766 Transcript_29923/m.45766 type:complete len:97 (+) Transcript_29923:883-1173(+)
MSDMFQNLEFYTEKMWHDYTRQFTNKKQIMSQDAKQSSDDEDDESVEEKPKKTLDKKKLPKKEEPKTFWGRVWQGLLDNFDLTEKEVSSDEEDEEP